MAGLLLAGAAHGQEEAPFPHEDHQGLFPVCSGCHQDMTGVDRTAHYPPASQCTGCHDGVDLDLVSWESPSERVSNVVFDHGAHALDLADAGDPAATCESCHSGDTGRMSVDGAERLETCWSCHAHEREEHFGPESAAAGAEASSASCEACHVPLASSGFGRERIEALEAPEGHEGDAFLLEGHAASAGDDVGRCATCHTSDRCASCHVSVDQPEIEAIPAAPPTMELPMWEASYPVPKSHETIRFDMAHKPGGEGAAECSTCHTSNDCLSCHVEPGPPVLAELPARSDVRAPGVHLDVEAPESHEALFFMSSHANLAAAEPTSCATCHTETYCVDCHDGPSDGGYHAPSFVARHAADAWGRDQECATCHSTAAFCRECHVDSGLGSRGRLGPGYHDAEPVWLLRHGGPARQNLESCASCHQQKDCVQCHGVLGAFVVSPHTSDFDAEAAWRKSPRTCIACHTSNPVGD
jgi:hypothetical protein